VILSYIPPFLDEQLICYLFKFSKKDADLRKTAEQIKDLKLKLRVGKDTIELSNSLGPNTERTRTKMNSIIFQVNKSKGITTTEELINCMNERFITSQVKQNENILDKLISQAQQKDEKITIKQMAKIIENSKSCGKDSIDFFVRMKELENALEKIKNEMEEMKKNELIRINNEYLMNDYERRFGVSLDIVISVIIGKECAFEEYTKQLREQKNFIQKRNFCKTFNFMEVSTKRSLPPIQRSPIF